MNETCLFARQELDRYMQRITGQNAHNIMLSVEGETSSPYDDRYTIDISAGQGTITGSCPRSLLIAVYRFLFLIGCRFLLPGVDGESIPQRPLTACTALESRTVPMRHRGICIEGAVSRENVLDMIDWLPKIGCNSYFIQFREGHNFFERWYTHQGNTLRQPEPYSTDDSRRITQDAEREIAKRSLIYHKVGHGWTCESIGYPSGGWHKASSEPLPEETRSLLAQVNGKRAFFGDIPLNTHLCYSNKEVRRRMVQEIVTYARENSQIHMLHIWLADNYNNICECENCRQHSQTDWYVLLLNEIDAALTAQGISTKLVFLIYFELLWPPKAFHLLHPERFVLMFAPITRTYTQPFYNEAEDICRTNPPPLPDYVYNQMVFPSDVKENLSFLYHWQKEFSGDSFDFDYHLMWDVDRESGGLKLARILYEDCQKLKRMGLNGLISCQQGRASFPSGIAQYIMGRTLFEPTCPFADLVEEYITAAFPGNPHGALSYLQLLSNGFSHPYMRGEDEGKTDADYAALFSDTLCRLQMVSPDIALSADAYGTRPWQVLKASLPIFQQLAYALKRRAEGAALEEMKQEADRLRDLVSSAEETIQPDLDAMYYNSMIGGFLEESENKLYQEAK